MKTSGLICLLLVILVTAVATLKTVTVLRERVDRARQIFSLIHNVDVEENVDKEANERRRNGLLGISNPIKQRDAFLYYWWEQYKNTSRLKRPTVVKRIQDAVTKVAYLDSRIELIGWILFGPQTSRSILRSISDKKHPPPCLKSTLKLFEEHCGTLIENAIVRSLANLCNYVIDKEAIKEAILLACGRQSTESHGIDVENPSTDLTLAPIPGTFEYCGRVSVNATPRTELQSHARSYKVMVAPSNSIPDK